MRRPSAPRSTWLTLGLSVLIVALFAALVDWPTVTAQLQQADWRYLAGASAALVAGLGAYAIRWRLLLGSRPTRLATFHAANVGHAVNTLVPLRAGEAARIVVLGRSEAQALTAVTSSVLVERLFEQVMRLAALGGALTFGVGLAVTPAGVAGALAFVALAAGGLWWLALNRGQILVHWPRMLARVPRVSETLARETLRGLLDGLAGLASPQQFLGALAWSLTTWGCFFVFHVLALQALSARLGADAVLSTALGALALAPPSAPTQPGVYHASVVAPLTLLGYNRDLLTAYAVVLHALQLVWMVGLGLWGLTRSGVAAADLFRSESPTA